MEREEGSGGQRGVWAMSREGWVGVGGLWLRGQRKSVGGDRNGSVCVSVYVFFSYFFLRVV